MSEALTYIEKTLADNYRKEIDQEENVWRSLPFFSATIALQLTALFQAIERAPPADTWTIPLIRSLTAVAIVCSLGALCFLLASIFPARFRYLSKDSELLSYAVGLMEDERNAANAGAVAPPAVDTLKAFIASQYAAATDNNRLITKDREARRSVAGLLTLLAVAATVTVVLLTILTYVPKVT